MVEKCNDLTKVELRGKLQEQEIDIIVDTGATSNYITESLVKEMNTNIIKIEDNKVTELAKGKKLN